MCVAGGDEQKRGKLTGLDEDLHAEKSLLDMVVVWI